jgi:hypothetical protein
MDVMDEFEAFDEKLLKDLFALFLHVATVGDEELATQLKLVGYDFGEGVVFVKSEGKDKPWKCPIDDMLGVIGDAAGRRKTWHQRNGSKTLANVVGMSLFRSTPMTG